MKSSLKNAMLVVLLGAAALMIGGCYTVEGAGRDVESLGEGVTEAADWARPYE